MFRQMTLGQLENSTRYVTLSCDTLAEKFRDGKDETAHYLKAMNDLEECLLVVRKAYRDFSCSENINRNQKKQSGDLPISAQIDYIDEDHFAFITPLLMNRRRGSRSRIFAKILAETIEKVAGEYGLTRKSGRVVQFHHVRHRDTSIADCDNLETSDILNALVNCVITDDSLDCCRVIHTQEIVGCETEEFTEIRIYPMEELRFTDKFS